VRYNSNLGHYTNFVNFFGLSALAVPFGFRPDGLPFGITLIGHPDADAALLDFGADWQRTDLLPLGRTSHTLMSSFPRVSIAVVGAHMDGLPLNHQLLARDGRLEFAGRTAPHYRLYALPGDPPQRPGLLRVAEGGAAIELEVWSLPPMAYGNFVETIPAPLGIGTIELGDGSTVQGFLCESYATAAARDITEFGGWRAYLKSLS
jgi:allophanate hydrolase